jgi:hypothetical protein
MRITAPAIGGAAVLGAIALVLEFRPAQPPPLADSLALSVEPVGAASVSAGLSNVNASLETSTSSRPATLAAAGAASVAARSPLPGEAPATPMADLMVNRDSDVPAGLAASEREFSAEPVDAAWAPGAEADLLATIAQIPNLKLIAMRVECRSTMCRLELTQPSEDRIDGAPRPFNLLLDSVGYEPRWMMVLGDRSRSIRSVAYLWRDGFAAESEPGQPHETG